jgi:hypothetical protein
MHSYDKIKVANGIQQRSVKICEPLDIEVKKNLEYAGDK